MERIEGFEKEEMFLKLSSMLTQMRESGAMVTLACTAAAAISKQMTVEQKIRIKIKIEEIRNSANEQSKAAKEALEKMDQDG